TSSDNSHLPGSKVINAFYEGYDSMDEDYDVICKFDADLIFPKDYLEKISSHFESDSKVGMAGGFCSIEKNGNWILENLTSKDHLRGALKAYRKECFKEIGGLKPSMGWDTADELLAQYHGWKIITDDSLHVKQLKITGFTYNKKAKLKQGQAFYKLRYGIPITLIASLKLAYKKKEAFLIKDYLHGYFKAKTQKMPFLVSKKEGAFIRRLRYKKMLSKLF
ncbi:MAG TPA: glycosyltransferase family 2 protein, partial [Salinimicrobium sp.]|nr:glycosyltransferase family 2 protein [Salinimicrobium sp.]